MKLPKFSLKRSPSKKSTTHGLKKWKEELDAAASERHAAAAPAAAEGNKRRITRSRSSVDTIPVRADPHIQRYRAASKWRPWPTCPPPTPPPSPVTDDTGSCDPMTL
jgi:hypothetical protein